MTPRAPRPNVWLAGQLTACAIGVTAIVFGVQARPVHPPAFACPPGSSLARVSLYGQTFEAGVPGRGDTPTVIVQHQDRGASVGNYVPILACVAYWTKAEQDARNAGLSIPPSNWTPPAATR